MEKGCNSDTETSASTDDSSPVSSRSRRGFLKQAAATSLLGVSGLPVATERASATDSSSDPVPTTLPDGALSEPPEPGTTIEAMDLDTAAFDMGIKVFGETIFTSDYGIFTEGRIVRGKSAEPSDNPDNIGSNNVIGGITAFGYDGFLFNGSLRNVQTFKGSVSYRLYDMS